ncbi:hypothetical protein Tco_0906648 [Tanacetum coccineum]|uniref:Reverse transcriptase domain-containing protein n=1 Tax=Tanacetum coccineum TaxID=301880 RepID=A0ABQ5CJD3_9ASTR
MTTLGRLWRSINLMPYSVWKNLSLPELTSTCMMLELADRSISEPIGIAKDVYVTVEKFQFPANFMTSRALIDVYEGEITLRVGREAITFNLDQTSRYTANYNHMTANRIDVIDMACEEYSQEVLGFSNVISSGNPTPYYDPIVSTSSPTLTPFGDSDFLLFEEADSFLAIEDDPTSPEVDPTYYDPDGDILLLEAILNSDPSPPPNQGNYFPEIPKDLKICEANNEKSSVNEPPEVELKDLPPHLEYAFLSFVTSKFSWKRTDGNLTVSSIKGCVIRKSMTSSKKEVEKLPYAINLSDLDSLWVRPVRFVPKKGGMTSPRAAKINILFQPIHYASKTMTEAQANYTSMKRIACRIISLKRMLSQDDAVDPFAQEIDVVIDIKKRSREYGADIFPD